MHRRARSSTLALAVILAALASAAPASAAGTAPAPPTRTPQVIGGTNASPTAWPWLVALLRPGATSRISRFFCGGSLIAPTWVLTAAHCAAVVQQVGGVDIHVGAFDLNGSDGERRSLKSVSFVPGWTGSVGSPDLALLELTAPSTRATVGLATDMTERAYDGTTVADVVGWGRTVNGGPASPILQDATVPVLSVSRCATLAGAVFASARHLCAGSSSVSACNGDSGGPLVAPDTSGTPVLVGVTSFGPVVCASGPGIWGRVSSFRSWIDPLAGTAPRSDVKGLRVLRAGGAVAALGEAGSVGDAMAACTARSDCTSIATSATGGAWVSHANCRVLSVGRAPALTSPDTPDPCYLAATPSRTGAWALTFGGRVFALGGDAAHHGQVEVPVNGTWLHIEAVPTGGGYWLVGNDGGIFTFGTAGFFGSTGDIRLNQPIVAMCATPSGKGYWMVARDGGVFSFGDAAFFGSAGATPLPAPVVAMHRTSSGRGYWLVAEDGLVLPYGDAASVGPAPSGAGRVVGAAPA